MKHDYVIIGGGIVGLAVGRRLLQTNSKLRVVVLDKEGTSHEHASGRNSGVLHAGFYYSPDSLKAKVTADGNRDLKEFCLKSGVEVKNVGKYVVTRNSSEIPDLLDLYNRGVANGVNLEIISELELSELEPGAKTFGKALWSPDTAIANPVEVTEAIARDFVRLGGQIMYDSKVTRVEIGKVFCSDTIYGTGHIVNCAGMQAQKIASLLGFAKDYATLPFLGTYVYTPELDGMFKSHVYPVPDKRNPFLGVHLTRTIDGRVKLGPTAIPIFSDEQYGLFKGFSISEFFRVFGTYPSFFSSPHHDVWSLVKTEVPKLNKWGVVKRGLALLNVEFPLRKAVWGRPGIRAQLYDKNQRKLEMDFVIQGDSNSTHVLNVVSPGWTSAITFSEKIVAEITKWG